MREAPSRVLGDGEIWEPRSVLGEQGRGPGPGEGPGRRLAHSPPRSTGGAEGRSRALPEHPPGPGGSLPPAERLLLPPGLGLPGRQTGRQTHPAASLSFSSSDLHHRQDAAFAAGDHRAPCHCAGAPLRLHHRQCKSGPSSGTRAPGGEGTVVWQGQKLPFSAVVYFPAWILAGNLYLPIAGLPGLGVFCTKSSSYASAVR